MHAHPVLALVTKIVVSIVGFAVLLAGIIMIVTPGPAIVLIPLGLAILSTEFDWARRWLELAREKAVRARDRAAAQDPRVRRRRRLLGALTFVVVVGAISWYLVVYDWPTFTVKGWDWVQNRIGFLPDLPGM